MKLSKIDRLQPEIDVILSIYENKILIELARPLSPEIKLVFQEEFARPGFNFLAENHPLSEDNSANLLRYSLIFPTNFDEFKITEIVAEIFTEHKLSSQIVETPGFQRGKGTYVEPT